MKLPTLIKKELEHCDVPYRIERGKRHWKVFVGKILCGILPMNCKYTDRRAELNLRSRIRKQIKDTKEKIVNKNSNASNSD